MRRKSFFLLVACVPSPGSSSGNSTQGRSLLNPPESALPSASPSARATVRIRIYKTDFEPSKRWTIASTWPDSLAGFSRASLAAAVGKVEAAFAFHDPPAVVAGQARIRTTIPFCHRARAYIFAGD